MALLSRWQFYRRVNLAAGEMREERKAANQEGRYFVENVNCLLGGRALVGLGFPAWLRHGELMLLMVGGLRLGHVVGNVVDAVGFHGYGLIVWQSRYYPPISNMCWADDLYR